MRAGRHTQRGLALVSVLWGVAILSIIAAAMVTSSLSTAYVGRNVWNATRGATLDEAAINRTILSLMDQRPGHQPAVDGTSRLLRFDSQQVRVWVQDESGRININFADKGTLQSLVVSAGAGQDKAEALADRIVALHSPNSALPGNTIAFHTTDELLAVPGMSAALYARILPLITVFGRTGSVNTQAAPRAVLLALPGATANSVADILRDRAQQRAANASTPLNTSGGTFAITAEAHVEGARTIRAAVVQFTGDETKPYWFLSWQ
jgi:general secretion pathway protein K